MNKAQQIKQEEYPQTSEVITHDKTEAVRLNKYISSSGYCSRREADRLIESGCVSIDGEVAFMGVKVSSNQEVSVNGTTISSNESLVYLVLHKPDGIICTTDIEIEDNIVTYMDYPKRIFPIGRLDRESSGLIILTNDGDVVNKILRSSYEHEKEYIVRVNRYITPELIEGLANGVQIYNPVTNAYQITKPCKVYQEGVSTLRIILSEGLNRQIRRMCTALDYRVITLQRVRIMNIVIDGLQMGEWRYLSGEEIKQLNHQIQMSANNNEVE